MTFDSPKHCQLKGAEIPSAGRMLTTAASPTLQRNVLPDRPYQTPHPAVPRHHTQRTRGRGLHRSRGQSVSSSRPTAARRFRRRGIAPRTTAAHRAGWKSPLGGSILRVRRRYVLAPNTAVAWYTQQQNHHREWVGE